jgi:uncharacterized membrane protein YjgN (DUF898 family)
MASPTCKSCGTAVDGQPAVKPQALAQPKPIQNVTPPAQSKPAQDIGQKVSQEDPQEKATEVMTKPPVAPTGTDQIRQLFFHGTGGSLFGIQMVNAFLTIITLGIYHFWGKVKVRNYLMSQTEFEGDRFAYHGTGKELLIGFVKAAIVFASFYLLLNSVPYLPGVAAKVVVFVLAYSLLLTFIPVAMVGSRRYRLSRISWRGVRFSFRGEVVDFIKIFLKGALLTVVTFGFYTPFFDVRRYAFMASHSYFGNQKFEFDGQGSDLFGSYILAVLLLLPTLGLYWFWFTAKKQRYLWDHTSIGASRFHSTVTGGALLLLSLGNLLLLIFTLGLGWPWVMVRNVRFAFTYLTLEGQLDLDTIQQEAQAASPTGEGLDSILDLDTGLGVA